VICARAGQDRKRRGNWAFWWVVPSRIEKSVAKKPLHYLTLDLGRDASAPDQEKGCSSCPGSIHLQLRTPSSGSWASISGEHERRGPFTPPKLGANSGRRTKKKLKHLSERGEPKESSEEEKVQTVPRLAEKGVAPRPVGFPLNLRDVESSLPSEKQSSSRRTRASGTGRKCGWWAVTTPCAVKFILLRQFRSESDKAPRVLKMQVIIHLQG